MFANVERPLDRPPNPWQIGSDFGLVYASNGLVSWLFAVSAPIAIILAIGSKGGLSKDEIASWIFGVFFVNGLFTILLSWLYRQPLVLLWTIPGAVLVGQSLNHLTFPQVVGVYYGTGALMLLLGMTGWVKRAMQMIPMPIVMGMVAGVFLNFGLDLIRSVLTDTPIAGPMVAIWLLLMAAPQLGRRCPPLIGALMMGALVTIVLGRYDPSTSAHLEFIHPVIPAPDWSLAAMIELVIPLAITVLIVQNGQGIAVLNAAGHSPPINAITIACGIGSTFSALVGGVSTCLTGPSNAILVASGERNRQYTSAIVVGLLSVLFALLAPTFTRLFLLAPKSLIASLAGLAMLRVLQAAFVVAFKDRFSLGSMIAFLVTVADIPLLNVGAAFWGLVAGGGISWLLERTEFVDEQDSQAD